VEQKLVLFHLVNDIVQHSAKKGFTELLDKFKSGIKESMPHLKEEKIAYKVPVTLLFLYRNLAFFAFQVLVPAFEVPVRKFLWFLVYRYFRWYSLCTAKVKNSIQYYCTL
jgi:hypothetical protein